LSSTYDVPSHGAPVTFTASIVRMAGFRAGGAEPSQTRSSGSMTAWRRVSKVGSPLIQV
jgi:hypothetical protein